MDQKRRTMLTAIRPAIILPFFLSRAKLHIGHNSALFPVKSKVAYSFKAYSARSETGGVRLVYLSALLPLQQGGEGG